MENTNPINANPESTEELLTFAAEIGSSLLIQNRELEELNKALSQKIENLTDDNVILGNQYKDLEEINQLLKSRIQFLEDENNHIYFKLKSQIKGENDIKDNLYLQKEKEIFQLNSEIENKENVIKKARETINEMNNLCQKQKDEIIALQIDQEENKKKNITLEKLKEERKEYRSSLESLEINYNKLDQENIELKESLDNMNNVINIKNKTISKYNSLNTGILEELEKIILNSMNSKQENNNLKSMKINENFIFNINIDNLMIGLNPEINEMLKNFFNINKLKLESILYEEIDIQEQLDNNYNTEEYLSASINNINNDMSMSGNDETAYKHSYDSDSIYNNTSMDTNEIILDPQFEMNSLFSPISEISYKENINEKKKTKNIELSDNDTVFNTIIHDNCLNDKDIKSIANEKEYLIKLYNHVSEYIEQNNLLTKNIKIPIFEKLKENIRNLYLNLINLIVSHVNMNQEQNTEIKDIDKVTSSSWLIYPLSLQYYKLLIYINDIENSIIKEINVNQSNESKKKIKQLKDELNSIKRSSRDLEDKIKISKLKRKSRNLNRLSQEFDNYNLNNLEKQYIYNDNLSNNNKDEEEDFRKFVSNIIMKNENEEKLKRSKQDIYNKSIYKNEKCENQKEITFENYIDSDIKNNKNINNDITSSETLTKPDDLKSTNLDVDINKITNNESIEEYNQEIIFNDTSEVKNIVYQDSLNEISISEICNGNPKANNNILNEINENISIMKENMNNEVYHDNYTEDNENKNTKENRKYFIDTISVDNNTINKDNEDIINEPLIKTENNDMINNNVMNKKSSTDNNNIKNKIDVMINEDSFKNKEKEAKDYINIIKNKNNEIKEEIIENRDYDKNVNNSYYINDDDDDDDKINKNNISVKEKYINNEQINSSNYNKDEDSIVTNSTTYKSINDDSFIKIDAYKDNKIEKIIENENENIMETVFSSKIKEFEIKVNNNNNNDEKANITNENNEMNIENTIVFEKKSSMTNTNKCNKSAIFANNNNNNDNNNELNIDYIDNYDDSDNEYVNAETYNKNCIFDSSEYLCSKKSIGTQTESEIETSKIKEKNNDKNKDIGYNHDKSFSIADTDNTNVFGDLDRKFSPIIESKEIEDPSFSSEFKDNFTTNTIISGIDDIDISLLIEKLHPVKNIKQQSKKENNNNNIDSSNNLDEATIINKKNTQLQKDNDKLSFIENKNASHGNETLYNIKSKNNDNESNKRNSILSNSKKHGDSNKGVSFSVSTKKKKKENSNISKLIFMFENNSNDDLKLNSSKSEDYKNIGKYGSVKNRASIFSNYSLNETTASSISLLDENYDFKGKNIDTIKFNSTDQLHDKNDIEIINKDETKELQKDDNNFSKNKENHDISINNEESKKAMSIEEMDDKISRILIDSDIFNLNNRNTSYISSANLSDDDVKDIIEDDDYDNIGFISSPFTSIPGIENVTRAMVGTWVKKLNKLKLYSKNRYLILHPFINVVSWSKYGPFSEPKKIHSAYVFEVKAKTNKTNDKILVIKTKTSKEIFIKFNSESEFTIWAKAFNLLAKYKNELKAFQNIQKTSYEGCPANNKHHSLLSYIGAGLIKSEMTSGNNGSV